MFTLITLFKKIVLAGSVLAIGLAAVPATGASAAGLKDASTPPAAVQARANTRLENTWSRQQTAYQRQGERLDKADEFIAKAQSLIDKASAKGWDTSAVQAALDAFAAVIPAAESAHENGAAIIAGHAGFDGNGKVVDRATAVATVKALGQVLKDTRTAMDGTGKALQEAIKAFRAAHRPTPTPAP